MNPLCNGDPRRQSRQQRRPAGAPPREESWAMAGVPRRQGRQQPASTARLRGTGRVAVSGYSRAAQGPAGETPDMEVGGGMQSHCGFLRRQGHRRRGPWTQGVPALWVGQRVPYLWEPKRPGCRPGPG